MLTALLMIQAATAAPPAAADPALAPAAALYDAVCLKAFPDDAAVDAAMQARGATPLTPAQVKVTLVDDPGRGWQVELAGKAAFVFLELPPYHACSVRWPAGDGGGGLAAYQAVADAYLAAHPGFAPIRPFAGDRGAVHITATGAQRRLSDGGADSLFVIDQTVTDPARRAAGETGVERRFVHQLAPPAAKP